MPPTRSTDRGPADALGAKDMIKLDINWKALAQLFEEYGGVSKQGRKEHVAYLVGVDSDAENIANEFWLRLKIGNAPVLIHRYTRVDKKEKRGPTRSMWRWRVGKQLEVYWFLTNIRRFIRGPRRLRIEEALRTVEEIVTKRRELHKLTMQDAPALELRLDKERKKGYMTRQVRSM